MRAIVSAAATIAVGAGLTGLICWWLARRKQPGSAAVSVVIGVAATLIVALVARPIEIIWDDILQPASTRSQQPPASASPSQETSPDATPPARPSESTVDETRPRSGPPSPTKKVTGYAALLSATAMGDRTVAIEAVTRREPATGSRFWFVLEVHGVSGTHSEFYPRQRLENQPQKFEFTLQIPTDADASLARTGRIVEVFAEVDKLFASGSPDPKATGNDFLLTAPCCAVSAEVELDFRD